MQLFLNIYSLKDQIIKFLRVFVLSTQGVSFGDTSFLILMKMGEFWYRKCLYCKLFNESFSVNADVSKSNFKLVVFVNILLGLEI